MSQSKWVPLEEIRKIHHDIKYLTKYLHGLQNYLAFCKSGHESITYEEILLIKEEIDRTAAFIYHLKKRMLDIDLEKIIGK
jgi:hypothetical protein